MKGFHYTVRVDHGGVFAVLLSIVILQNLYVKHWDIKEHLVSYYTAIVVHFLKVQDLILTMVDIIQVTMTRTIGYVVHHTHQYLSAQNIIAATVPNLLVLSATHLSQVHPHYIHHEYCFVIKMIAEPIGSNCTNGAVRLVNGATSNEGRVEYCYNGNWVPFCGMSSITASVICNQLGYNELPILSSCRC